MIQALAIIATVVGIAAGCLRIYSHVHPRAASPATEPPFLAIIRSKMHRYPKSQSNVSCRVKNAGKMAANELRLRIACCPIGKPDLLAIVFDDEKANPLAAGEATSFESEPFQEPQDIGPEGLHVVFVFTYSDPTTEGKRRQQCDFKVCDIAAWQPGDSLREATVQEREEIRQSSDARERLDMDKW